MSTATRPPQAPQANPVLLHRFLGIGMVIMAAAMAIARYSGFMGEPSPDGSPVPAYALSGASALMLLTSLMVLKPRARRRRAGQTREAYWADADTTKTVMPVWFLLEGAGVVASVAFLLSSHPVAAVLIVVAVALYWMNGPAIFENE